MKTELSEPLPPAKENIPKKRPVALGWWLAGGLATIIWLLMFFFAPQLRLDYTPEQLSTIISQGTARGFYKSETDPAGTRYSWTAEQAILQFDFEGRKPLYLHIGLRSAALAGGPDAPVRILANGVEIGQFKPNPAEADFQTFSLKFMPPPTASQRLKLELISPAFKPPGDSRTLGTMVNSITLDKREAWSGLRRLILAVWASFVAILAGLRFVTFRQQAVVRKLVAGLSVATAGVLFGVLFNIGVLERETYRLWLAGAFYLLIFSLALMFQSFPGLSAQLLTLFRSNLSNIGSRFRPNLARLLKNPLAAILFLVLLASIAVYNQLQFDKTLYLLDINIYLEAGRKITQGQNAYQPFIIGTSFFYPPPALLFFAPLSSLAPEIAHWFWLTLSGLCYLLSLALLRQTFRFSRWFLLVGLIYLPFWETLSVGQINTIVLLGLSLFCWGWRSTVTPLASSIAVNSPKLGWLSEAGVMLATLLKMTPALLLLPVLLARQWGRLGRLVAIFTVASLVPILLWGFGVWLDFLQVLPNLFLTGSSSRSYSLAPTLDWLLTGLHDGEQSATAISLSRLLAVGLIGGWLWLALTFRKTAWLLVLSAGVVVLTISSSIVWYHHFVFLLIPILYLLGTKQTGSLLVGLFSLTLVQADRLAQKIASVPPFLSATASVLLFSWLIFRALQLKNRPLIEEELKNAIPE